LERWAIPFPLEIVIEGTPVALGGSSSSKERWKAEVGASARARLREVSEWEWLDERRVAVTIFYFLDAEMQGDIYSVYARTRKTDALNFSISAALSDSDFRVLA